MMPSRFDEFWATALRKIGKGDARKCYGRAIKRADEDVILDAWGTANRGWRGKDIQFVPHPSTWLNQDRWDDEQPSSSPVNGAASLEVIASHVKRPWCERGRYSREVLKQCVAADLLTRDEMEAAL